MLLLNVIFTFFFGFQPTQSICHAETLTESRVLDLAKKTERLRELTEEKSETSEKLLSVLSKFDWTTTLSLGLESDQKTGLNLLGDRSLERRLASLSLSKAWSSGTNIQLELDSIAQKDLLTRDESVYSQTASVTFKQNLWRNSFGREDRALRSAGEFDEQSRQFRVQVEYQSAVVEVLNIFWQTYVAQESLRRSEASILRQNRLLRSVEKRAQLRSAAPGELAQVRAEIESSRQAKRAAEIEYNRKSVELRRAIGWTDDKVLILDIEYRVPLRPSELPVQVEGTDRFKSQQAEAASLQFASVASKEEWKPELRVVASLESTGAAGTQGSTQTQVLDRQRPGDYVGAEFVYRFGSGARSLELSRAEARRRRSQLEFERTSKELLEELKNLNGDLPKLQEIVVSKWTQVELRKKAVDELLISYNQGRTDVSVYLDSINKWDLSQLEAAKALADYHYSFNRRRALLGEF